MLRVLGGTGRLPKVRTRKVRCFSKARGGGLGHRRGRLACLSRFLGGTTRRRVSIGYLRCNSKATIPCFHSGATRAFRRTNLGKLRSTIGTVR